MPGDVYSGIQTDEEIIKIFKISDVNSEMLFIRQ